MSNTTTISLKVCILIALIWLLYIPTSTKHKHIKWQYTDINSQKNKMHIISPNKQRQCNPPTSPQWTSNCLLRSSEYHQLSMQFQLSVAVHYVVNDRHIKLTLSIIVTFVRGERKHVCTIKLLMAEYFDVIFVKSGSGSTAKNKIR